MSVKGPDVVEKIIKYKTYLESYSNRSDVDEKNILIILSKLKALPVTLDHLQETSIGKTVNGFRKHFHASVANFAKQLVSKWKQLVSDIVPSAEGDSVQISNCSANEVCIDAHHNSYTAKKTGSNCDNASSGCVTQTDSASNSKAKVHCKSRDDHGAHSSRSASSEQRKPEKFDSISTGEMQLVNQVKMAASTSDEIHQILPSHSKKASAEKKISASDSSIRMSASPSSAREKHLVISDTSTKDEKERHQAKRSHSNEKVEAKVKSSSHKSSHSKINESDSSYHDKLHQSFPPSRASQVQDANTHIYSSKQPKSSEMSKDDGTLETSRSSVKNGCNSSAGEETSDHLKRKRTRYDVKVPAEDSDVDIDDDEASQTLSFEQMLNYDAARIQKVPRTKTSKKAAGHSLHQQQLSSSNNEQFEVPYSKSSSQVKKSNDESEGKQHSESVVGSLGGAEDWTLTVPQPTSRVDISADDILNMSPDLYNIKSEVRKQAADEDGSGIGSLKRHSRTTVYAGRKPHFVKEVPKLFDACLRVMMDNIDDALLDVTRVRFVPYEIIKPVLERCTPQQLYSVEDLYSNLACDTDELWEVHCRRDFRGTRPDEMETWRELYLRLFDERDERLKRLTASISQTQAEKQAPVRKTKIAYVNTIVKPPRDVRIRQLKHRTNDHVRSSSKNDLHDRKPVTSNSDRISATSVVSSGRQHQVAANTSSCRESGSKAAGTKIIAPMMAKTLRQMKTMRR